jgi:hypothetical protein
MKRLGALVLNPGADQSTSVSVAAAAILLERGWGRPAQPVTGEDGKAIEIIIRKMTGNDDDNKS